MGDSGVRLADSRRAGLTGLESLTIRDSIVTDAGVHSLRGLKALKLLRIVNPDGPISDEALKRLQGDLPNLKTVR